MVTRCVCHEVTFETVRRLRDEGLDLAAIVERTGCGTGCGTCRPYLPVVLATGRTTLPVLSEAQARAMIATPLA